MNVVGETETNRGKIPEKIGGPSCKGQMEELITHGLLLLIKCIF
jgi:hypothetical protein